MSAQRLAARAANSVAVAPSTSSEIVNESEFDRWIDTASTFPLDPGVIDAVRTFVCDLAVDAAQFTRIDAASTGFVTNIPALGLSTSMWIDDIRRVTSLPLFPQGYLHGAGVADDEVDALTSPGPLRRFPVRVHVAKVTTGRPSPSVPEEDRW